MLTFSSVSIDVIIEKMNKLHFFLQQFCAFNLFLIKFDQIGCRRRQLWLIYWKNVPEQTDRLLSHLLWRSSGDITALCSSDWLVGVRLQSADSFFWHLSLVFCWANCSVLWPLTSGISLRPQCAIPERVRGNPPPPPPHIALIGQLGWSGRQGFTSVTSVLSFESQAPPPLWLVRFFLFSVFLNWKLLIGPDYCGKDEILTIEMKRVTNELIWRMNILISFQFRFQFKLELLQHSEYFVSSQTKSFGPKISCFWAFTKCDLHQRSRWYRCAFICFAFSNLSDWRTCRETGSRRLVYFGHFTD